MRPATLLTVPVSPCIWVAQCEDYSLGCFRGEPQRDLREFQQAVFAPQLITPKPYKPNPKP